MKVKISGDYVTRLRIQESFDFLRVHESDLTPSQADLVKSLRRQNKDYGLSEKQLQILFDVVKFLKPAEILTIRKNY